MILEKFHGNRMLRDFWKIYVWIVRFQNMNLYFVVQVRPNLQIRGRLEHNNSRAQQEVRSSKILIRQWLDRILFLEIDIIADTSRSIISRVPWETNFDQKRESSPIILAATTPLTLKIHWESDAIGIFNWIFIGPLLSSSGSRPQG